MTDALARSGLRRSLWEPVPRRLWDHSCRIALANALMFAMFAWLVLLASPRSMTFALLPPALYFTGSVVSFVWFVRNGGAFAAITWFVIGTGLYFGLGTVAAGVYPDPRTVRHAAESALVSDLLRVNVLNASSIALVILSAVPVLLCIGDRRQPNVHASAEETLLRLFPAVSVIAAVALLLQLVFFPVATNLTVRSFIASVALIVPFFAMNLGLQWRRLSAKRAIVGAGIFASGILLGLLTFSKLSVVSLVVALVVGVWVNHRTIRSQVVGALLIIAMYLISDPLVARGRDHELYEPVQNSPSTRFAILVDTVADSSTDRRTIQSSAPAPYEEARPLMRFSAADVQAYLIDEYDHDAPGNSLSDAWVAAIPRVFW